MLAICRQGGEIWPRHTNDRASGSFGALDRAGARWTGYCTRTGRRPGAARPLEPLVVPPATTARCRSASLQPSAQGVTRIISFQMRAGPQKTLSHIWEQLGNRTAQTPRKTKDQGRPGSKMRQQLRKSGPVCKTSIPGSNPGGASKILQEIWSFVFLTDDPTVPLMDPIGPRIALRRALPRS